jgi:predicted acylesterase/phospholipase RssA
MKIPNTEKTVPVIKHLVIAGGAHMGFSYYGALKTLIQKQFIQMANIETIYTTSVGSIIAIFLLLQYEWDTVDTYLIDRPWNKVFSFDFPTLVKSLSKGGIYDISSFQESISPMLLGKDLSPEITLQEFYDYSNTELHFVSTSFANLGLCDISYKTHPDWKLLEAVYATSCLPVIFVPFEKSPGEIYIDGAINMNYPMNRCLEDGHSSDTVLGVSYHFEKAMSTGTPKLADAVNPTFQLFYFILDLFFKLWYRIKMPLTKDSFTAPYQLDILYNGCPQIEVMSVLKSSNKRKELIDVGVHSADFFLTKNNIL